MDQDDFKVEAYGTVTPPPDPDPDVPDEGVEEEDD
jgi:hypothetical protein